MCEYSHISMGKFPQINYSRTSIVGEWGSSVGIKTGERECSRILNAKIPFGYKDIGLRNQLLSTYTEVSTVNVLIIM